MIDLRRQLLGVLQVARGIAPGLGMHRVRVVVVRRTWTGSGNVQTGPSTVTKVVLGSPDPTSGQMLPPHVRGAAGDAEVIVGPLTPFDPATAPRGFTPAQLVPGVPADAKGLDTYYMLTFPDGVARPYQVEPRGTDTTNPLHYTITLRALNRALPF